MIWRVPNRLRAMAALLCLGLLLPSCGIARLHGYAGYTQTQLSGDLGLAPSLGSSSVITTADVEDDLNLGESGAPYVRVEAGGGPVSVTVSAFRYGSSADGTLTGTFGNIPAGFAVHSDAEIINVKAAVAFDLINIGVVRISPGIAVDYFDIDVEVTATSFSAFDRVDVTAPVPMLFVQVAADVGPVGATVDVGAMDVDLPDAGGTFFDVEAMLRVEPFDHVEFIAGYRWISIDADGEASSQGFDADLELQGWFVGGGVTF